VFEPNEGLSADSIRNVNDPVINYETSSFGLRIICAGILVFAVCLVLYIVFDPADAYRNVAHGSLYHNCGIQTYLREVDSRMLQTSSNDGAIEHGQLPIF
jgi:hypothetical protein